MKPARRKARSVVTALAKPARVPLLADLRRMILSARQHVARAVDAGLVALHWEVGHRIRHEVLHRARAAYGAEIVSTVSRQLEPEFGRGFSEKSLRHMIRFAEAFPRREIVSTLSRVLAWSHFLEIIYVEDPLAREFYAEMCRLAPHPLIKRSGKPTKKISYKFLPKAKRLLVATSNELKAAGLA